MSDSRPEKCPGKLNFKQEIKSKQKYIVSLLQVVRIFTSSTFTDMLMERNTLMEYVYPKIKEYCREKHGLEYQVVDMRWGVR